MTYHIHFIGDLPYTVVILYPVGQWVNFQGLNHRNQPKSGPKAMGKGRLAPGNTPQAVRMGSPTSILNHPSPFFTDEDGLISSHYIITRTSSLGAMRAMAKMIKPGFVEATHRAIRVFTRLRHLTCDHSSNRNDDVIAIRMRPKSQVFALLFAVVFFAFQV